MGIRPERSVSPRQATERKRWPVECGSERGTATRAAAQDDGARSAPLASADDCGRGCWSCRRCGRAALSRVCDHSQRVKRPVPPGSATRWQAALGAELGSGRAAWRRNGTGWTVAAPEHKRSAGPGRVMTGGSCGWARRPVRVGPNVSGAPASANNAMPLPVTEKTSELAECFRGNLAALWRRWRQPTARREFAKHAVANTGLAGGTRRKTDGCSQGGDHKARHLGESRCWA